MGNKIFLSWEHAPIFLLIIFSFVHGHMVLPVEQWKKITNEILISMRKKNYVLIWIAIEKQAKNWKMYLFCLEPKPNMKCFFCSWIMIILIEY